MVGYAGDNSSIHKEIYEYTYMNILSIMSIVNISESRVNT